MDEHHEWCLAWTWENDWADLMGSVRREGQAWRAAALDRKS